MLLTVKFTASYFRTRLLYAFSPDLFLPPARSTCLLLRVLFATILSFAHRSHLHPMPISIYHNLLDLRRQQAALLLLMHLQHF